MDLGLSVLEDRVFHTEGFVEGPLLFLHPCDLVFRRRDQTQYRSRSARCHPHLDNAAVRICAHNLPRSLLRRPPLGLTTLLA